MSLILNSCIVRGYSDSRYSPKVNKIVNKRTGFEYFSFLVLKFQLNYKDVKFKKKLIDLRIDYTFTHFSVNLDVAFYIDAAVFEAYITSIEDF